MISVNEKGILDLSKLYDNQKKFIRSQKLHTAIVGGYQSGKSLAGVIKVITKLLINPQVPCAYYLPTYGLIEDMLVPKFKELFEKIGIAYIHNKKNSKFTTPYGEVWMRSMDNPDRIISYSVGYSLVDEADVVPSNKMGLAYGRIVSRNSYKTDSKNSIDFVTTPEGFGFMHKLFVKKANDNKLLLKLSTLDNKENLGDGYIQGLREAYTEQQLQAYLNGEFVNLTSGTVFHVYDRKENGSIREVKSTDKLHVGMDFNITNMSAVFHVVDGKNIHAVDEITGAYDTSDMIMIIKEKYPKHRIIVYPDASGSNRNTAASTTDIKLLKAARFTIRVGKQNPRIKDRVTTANVAFKNAKGEHTYFINAENCPVYAEALEQQVYKNDVPDKSGGFDHINEAGTYPIYMIKNVKGRASISAG